MSSVPSNLMSICNPTLAPDQSIYEESTTQKARLGTEVTVGNTKFRYASAGTNLVAGGVLTKTNDPVVNKATVGAAVAVGTFEVPIYASSALTANQFADAYLVVMDSGGEGITYRIKSHGAITATTAGQKVVLYDPIASGGAMTTAGKVTIVPNPYNAVLSGTDVTATCPVVGIAPIAVTSGNYFWAAVSGPAGVKLSNGNATFGSKLCAATTGYALAVDATANATSYVGICLSLTGTAYDTVLTYLNVDALGC